jgi:hypothetical protein
MLKLLSIAALASTTIIAAAATSPVSAAAVTVRVPTTSVRAGTVGNATGTREFVPVITVQTPRQGPKQRRWVCGPIVNYDGSPHCHWVPTPTYP